MMRFLSGLILGVILGVIATLVLLVVMARPAPEPFEWTVPDELPAGPNQLAAELDACPFEVGFFAKDLTTGKTVDRFADRPVCLASITKLFCLTELYRRHLETGLDLTQTLDVGDHGPVSLQKAADLMIGRSDNAATQALAELLGYDRVNSIPGLLGLDSLGTRALPGEEELRRTLDRRIFGPRIAPPGLALHGTARDIVRYFDQLLAGQVISEPVSDAIIDFLFAHPKPFSIRYAGQYEFAGKGGNILWTRPPKHYAMMGWGLLIRKPSGDHIALCVWGEWFGENVPPETQSQFLMYVTDSVISMLER